MAVATSILLCLAIATSFVIGPGSRPWFWGISLVALGMAQVPALVSAWRRQEEHGGKILVTLGFLTAGWFGFRCLTSPASDPALSDGLLLAAAVGACLCGRTILRNATATRVFHWFMAATILANGAVALHQLDDRRFSVLYPSLKGLAGVTGFFIHYNETANFIVAAAFLVAAGAVSRLHGPSSRIVLGISAIIGFGLLALTHSRGGILAGIIGFVLFAILLVIALKQEGSRHFPKFAIGVPIIVIGLLIAIPFFLAKVQEARGGGNDFLEVMDGNIRLHLLGIALSTIRMHPWLGGGSRSFEWECYQFLGQDVGNAGNRPELVHNEIIQSFTDYGFIGFALLSLLLAVCVVKSIMRISVRESNATSPDRMVVIGCICAFVAMFVQSCFSFVFHLLPGTILLGFVLGGMSLGNNQGGKTRILLLHTPTIITLLGIPAAIVLLVFGWKGVLLTNLLGPVYRIGGESIGIEEKSRLFDRAYAIWPLGTLSREHGELLQAAAKNSTAREDQSLRQRAIAQYDLAVARNPFDPGTQLNRANLNSSLGKDGAAEFGFAEAIRLQGLLEPGFRSLQFAAHHYHRKGLRLSAAGQDPEAIRALGLAVQLNDRSINLVAGWGPDVKTRVDTRLALGRAMERIGDHAGAMKEYETAAAWPYGKSAHFFIAMLLRNQAETAWRKRDSSQALRLFLAARKQISGANPSPPEITESDLAGAVTALDQRIELLRSAGITVDD